MMDVFGLPDLLVAGCVVLAALAFVVREAVAGALRAVDHDLWRWTKRRGGRWTGTGSRKRGNAHPGTNGTSAGRVHRRAVLRSTDQDGQFSWAIRQG